MTDTRKVQLGAEFDASGVKQGTQQAKDAVRDMAQGVQASAQEASKSVAGMGAGASKAAEEFQKSEKSIVASLQRQTARLEAAGKGARAYQEALLTQRGLDPAQFEPYLAALDKADRAQRKTASSLGQVGVAAAGNQTAFDRADQAQRRATASLGQMGVSAGQTQAALRQLPAQFTDIFTSLASGQAPLLVLIQQGGQIKDSFGGIGPALRAVTTAIGPTTLALAGFAAGVGAVVLANQAGAAEADAYRRALVLSGNAAGATTSQLAGMAAAVGSMVGGQARAAAVLAQLASTGQLAAGGFEKMAEAAIRLERVGGPAVQKTVDAFAELAKSPLQASIKLNESTNFLTVSLYRQIKALDEQGRKAEAASLAQSAYFTTSNERTQELERNLSLVEKAWLKVKDAAEGARNAALGIGRDNTTDQALAAARASRDEILRSAGGKEPAPGTFSAGRLAVANERIVQLAEQARQERAVAAASAERAAATKQAIEADKDAKKHTTELAAEERKRIALLNELAGLSSDYYEDLTRLQALRKAGTLTELQYVDAIGKLIQRQPMVVQAEKQRLQQLQQYLGLQELRAEGEREIVEAENAATRARQAAVAQIEQQLQGARDEASAADLVARGRYTQAQAMARVTLSRMEDERARLVNDPAEIASLERRIALQRQLVELTDQGAVREANARASEQSAQAWQETANDIRGSLTDAFRESFRDSEDFGKAFAKNLGAELKARLATAIAEGLAGLALQAVGLSLTGAAGGAGAAGQATGYLQAAQAANTLYGYGKSAYGYVSGLASTGSTLGASTGAYTSMANSQVLAAYGVEGAGAATGGVTGAAGSGASSGVAMSAWAAAIALGVYKANQDYSAGFRRDQARDVGSQTYGASGSFEFAQATLLSKLGVSDRWADLLSGATAVAALIGRAAPRVEGAGVQGRIAAGDFAGTAYADVVEKGGLFRSDKRYTETSVLSDELGRYLDAASRGVFDKAKEFGAALGLPTDALAKVTSDIKVTLTDDVEKNMDEITKALGGYGDKLVETWKAEVAQFAQYGEGTAQTIARVAAAVGGVNEVLDTLGLTALKASVDGGKAAVALQTLFGDLGTLQTAAGGYLQGFYSEDERKSLQRRAIGDALGDVGLAVPASREAFRSLVEAQDLMSESGRKAFAVLMGVSEAFTSLAPSADEMAKALADQVERVTSQRESLQMDLWEVTGNTVAIRAREREALDSSNRALYDQVKALEDQRDATDKAARAAEKAADAAQKAAEADAARARTIAGLADNIWNNMLGGVRDAFGTVSDLVKSERQRLESEAQRQISDLDRKADDVERRFDAFVKSLGSNIDSLRGDIAGDGGRSEALRVLRDAQATFSRGGSVDLEATRDAAGVAARVQAGGFSTAADFRLEQVRTLVLLKDVQASARQQQTRELGVIGAQQVAIEKTLDEQLGVLDLQLEEARGVAARLISIDGGVKTVAQAIAALAQAVAIAQVARGDAGASVATGRWVQSGDSEIWAATGGAVAGRQLGASDDETLIRGRGSMFTVTEARAFVNDRLAAGDITGLYARAVAEGIDSAALDALMGWAPGTSLAEALRRKLPAFEQGSAYVPSTGLAVVHQGERIIPATENVALTRILAGAGREATLVGEMRALRQEVTRLRAESGASMGQVVEHSRRTSETLEGWSIVGMPQTESVA